MSIETYYLNKEQPKTSLKYNIRYNNCYYNTYELSINIILYYLYNLLN